VCICLFITNTTAPGGRRSRLNELRYGEVEKKSVEGKAQEVVKEKRVWCKNENESIRAERIPPGAVNSEDRVLEEGKNHKEMGGDGIPGTREGGAGSGSVGRELDPAGLRWTRLAWS